MAMASSSAGTFVGEVSSSSDGNITAGTVPRLRDRAAHPASDPQENKDVDVDENENENSDAIEGSTWLAALHVLALSTAHATERLFCAQTLLHRLRRMKLEDAMDVDMEDGYVFGAGNTVVDVLVTKDDDPTNTQRHAAALQHLYSRTAHQLLASLPQHSHLLQQLFLQQQSQQQQQQIRGEDQIKGEMGLVTLAVLAVETAHAEYGPPQHSQQQHAIFSSLLATLGAAMAAMALRLHAPSNETQPHGNNGPTNAIVPMVTRSIQTVVLHVQQQQHNLSASMQEQQMLANNACVCACLAAIPDTLLGCPGGARGRLSIDPKSLQAVNTELRSRATGVDLLLQTLTSLPLPPTTQSSTSDASATTTTTASFHQVVLGACERWAKFVPLPMDFVNQISPIAAQYLTPANANNNNNDGTTLVQRTASMFFVTLFESGAVTVSEALAASVGLAASSLGDVQQGNRKRQSSKSKKRHKERLQNALEDNAADRLLAAQAECMERGRVACRAAILSWDGIQSLATQALSSVHMNPNTTSGFGGGEEGPIACLCTCAMACLPHMIRNEQTNNTASPQQQQQQQQPEEEQQQQQNALFEAILTKLCQVCASPDRSVRSLSYEPLSAIHSALAERPITSVNTTLTPLEVTALHHVHQV
eukprot:scaffold26342_cov54-Attheya_sp.AAC.3